MELAGDLAAVAETVRELATEVARPWSAAARELVELDADLDDARERLGDEFALDQLVRTPAQRRADALLALARAGARCASEPTAPGS